MAAILTIPEPLDSVSHIFAMGKSAKAKKEKKKDFVKPKLKVGRGKAKPDNFTDTSFKAQCNDSSPMVS